jgi:hypothetical protein
MIVLCVDASKNLERLARERPGNEIDLRAMG